MTIFKQLSAERIVAFDKEGAAVVLPPESWSIRVDENRGLLEVANGPTKQVFGFRDDLCALVVGGEELRTAWAKTVGRMALTGLATTLIAGKGRGLGGALMDLSVRGTAKKEWIEGMLIFRDTSVFTYVVTENEMQKLRSLIPAVAESPAAIDRAVELSQKLRRIVLDGDRAISELTARAQAEKAEAAEKLKLADSEDSFEVRDTARRESEKLLAGARDLENLLKGAKWDLKQIKANDSAKAGKRNLVNTVDRGEVQRMSLPRFLLWAVLLTAILILFVPFIVATILSSFGVSSNASTGVGLLSGIAAVVLSIRWLLKQRRGAT